MNRFEVHLADDAATEALGARLALSMKREPGGVVYLRGRLGAGKTTLARGWLRALGVGGSIRSPTYTLIEPYSLDDGRELLHLDLYRLKTPEELDGLGLDDYPPTHCWWLVEWPECGDGRLPPATLDIELRAEHDGRRAVIDAMLAGTALDVAMRDLPST